MKCIVCNKELIGKQTKFCCNKCKHQTTNNKHQNYVKQQERALTRKKELISLLGGKCSKCGYNKNYAALQFHHLNPIEKEHNLDARKLSNSTWEWCINEAKKCILLCANCHFEEHHSHLNVL